MKKIFVVDDEPSIQDYLKVVLEEWGYAYDSWDSGAEAFEKIAESKPDLVLLDVMLPDTDGITLCRRLRSSPKTGNIPVIMVTCLTDSATIHDAQLFGAMDYISKPIDPDKLKNKIEKTLIKPA